LIGYVDGKYPDFPDTGNRLDGLFKAKGNVSAKTILFILNLDSWQKIIKIDLLAILDFDAAI